MRKRYVFWPNNSPSSPQKGKAIDQYVMLQDQFLINAAGPLATPRDCVPGPGNLTLVQNDGNFSIVGERLIVPGQVSPNYGDQDIYDAIARDRICGLSFLGKFSVAENTSESMWGWESAVVGNTPINSFYIYATGGQLRVVVNAISAYMGYVYAINTEYEIAVILRTTGAWYCVRGGVFVDWKLFWVDNTQAVTPLYNRFRNYDHTGYISNWRITKQDDPWTSQYGIATNTHLLLTSPAVGVMEPNALVEFTWTPVAAETLEISLRQTDADNRYIVRCSQAGSTIKLIKREAAAEVELESAACVWNAGTVYRIMVTLDGTTITAIAEIKATGGGLAYRFQEIGANFNSNATGMGVSGFAHGTEFVSWPRDITKTLLSSALLTRYRIFTVGDSKTLNYEWLATTTALINDANCEKYATEAPARCAVANATITSIKAQYETAVGNAIDTPYAILFNFGANECAAMPAEAIWKADYLERIDYARSIWPNCLIYIAKAWRRGYNAECAILADWVDDIVASRGHCYVGSNENIWMENGDNGVTYTSDGVHYSAAGTTECGVQWRSILGL